MRTPTRRLHGPGRWVIVAVAVVVALTVGTLFALHTWSRSTRPSTASYVLRAAPVQQQEVAGTVVQLTVRRGPLHRLDQQNLWYVTQSSPDSGDIGISWTDSPTPRCGMVVQAQLAEDADRIVIQLTTDAGSALSCSAVGRGATTTLHLSEPLGTRPIEEYLPPGWS